MSMSTLTGSCKRRRVAGKTSPVLIALLEAVGAEDGGANMQVYLITVSRVFRGTAAASGFRDVEGMSRAELRDLVRDAFDDPIPADTGRPRTRGSILDVVTAKEKHADGTVHFHVVVKLSEKMRFKQVKLTLQERHKSPSHFRAPTPMFGVPCVTCTSRPRGSRTLTRLWTSGHGMGAASIWTRFRRSRSLRRRGTSGG